MVNINRRLSRRLKRLKKLLKNLTKERRRRVVREIKRLRRILKNTPPPPLNTKCSLCERDTEVSPYYQGSPKCGLCRKYPHALIFLLRKGFIRALRGYSDKEEVLLEFLHMTYLVTISKDISVLTVRREEKKSLLKDPDRVDFCIKSIKHGHAQRYLWMLKRYLPVCEITTGFRNICRKLLHLCPMCHETWDQCCCCTTCSEVPAKCNCCLDCGAPNHSCDCCSFSQCRWASYHG
jgi:hypothetical protein